MSVHKIKNKFSYRVLVAGAAVRFFLDGLGWLLIAVQ